MSDTTNVDEIKKPDLTLQKLLKALQQVDSLSAGTVDIAQFKTMCDLFDVSIVNLDSSIQQFTTMNKVNYQALIQGLKQDSNKTEYSLQQPKITRNNPQQNNISLPQAPVGRGGSYDPKTDSSLFKQQVITLDSYSPNSNRISVVNSRGVYFPATSKNSKANRQGSEDIKQALDFGFCSQMVRKSDSPTEFQIEQPRKLKVIDFFSPLSETKEHFPQSGSEQRTYEKMKELLIDQRIINIIRREYLKVDKEEKGKVSIEMFKPVIIKVCQNDIVKSSMKELIQIFSHGKDCVEYSYLKALSYLLMFWTKAPKVDKNESTELKNIIQQSQIHKTQVRTQILELLEKLQGKLEQKYFDVKKAFRFFDVNNSGDISMNEFQLTLDMLQMDINEDQGIQIFKFLDTNQDGSISFDEFSLIYSDQRSRFINNKSSMQIETNSDYNYSTISRGNDFSSIKCKSVQRYVKQPLSNNQQNHPMTKRLEKIDSLSQSIGKEFRQDAERKSTNSKKQYKTIDYNDNDYDSKFFVDRNRVGKSIDPTAKSASRKQRFLVDIVEQHSKRGGYEVESLMQRLKQNQEQRKNFFNTQRKLNKTSDINNNDLNEDNKSASQKFMNDEYRSKLFNIQKKKIDNLGQSFMSGFQPKQLLFDNDDTKSVEHSSLFKYRKSAIKQ